MRSLTTPRVIPGTALEEVLVELVSDWVLHSPSPTVLTSTSTDAHYRKGKTGCVHAGPGPTKPDQGLEVGGSGKTKAMHFLKFQQSNRVCISSIITGVEVFLFFNSDLLQVPPVPELAVGPSRSGRMARTSQFLEKLLLPWRAGGRVCVGVHSCEQLN